MTFRLKGLDFHEWKERQICKDKDCIDHDIFKDNVALKLIYVPAYTYASKFLKI